MRADLVEVRVQDIFPNMASPASRRYRSLRVGLGNSDTELLRCEGSRLHPAKDSNLAGWDTWVHYVPHSSNRHRPSVRLYKRAQNGLPLGRLFHDRTSR